MKHDILRNTHNQGLLTHIFYGYNIGIFICVWNANNTNVSLLECSSFVLHLQHVSSVFAV